MTRTASIIRLLSALIHPRWSGRAGEAPSGADQLLESVTASLSRNWRLSQRQGASPPSVGRRALRGARFLFPSDDLLKREFLFSALGRARGLRVNEVTGVESVPPSELLYSTKKQDKVPRGYSQNPKPISITSELDPFSSYLKSLGIPKEDWNLVWRLCKRDLWSPLPKRRRSEEVLFRIAFQRSIERGLSAFFHKKIVIPRSWRYVECVRVAKFCFNAGLSMVLDTPLPPNPVPLELFWPREVLDGLREGDVRLAVVLSQLKRNMPLLTKDRVSEAKKKHRKCVCRPASEFRVPSDSLFERAARYGKIFGKSIARRKQGWTVKDALVSESASFESFRENGGGRKEALCRGCEDHEGKGSYHACLWHRFMTEDIDQARVAAANANMKARIITAHHVACNYFRPLQQLLHARLRRIPVFELTGSMPTVETFRGFSVPSPQTDTLILSADFSCATDGINPELTKTILYSILQELPAPDDLTAEEWNIYKRKALSSITSSTLYYSLTDCVEQTYGQMMGHLLSFPILNLVNFSIYAEYSTKVGTYSEYEMEQCVWGELDIALRINGDDLISKETKENYPSYVQTVDDCGWELSVGKSYFHPRFGCVNSQFFDFERREFVAAEFKFGGLQKGASSDSFGQWLLRLVDSSRDNSYEPVTLFVSFYRDWIFKTFGHPLIYGYFTYLPIETQHSLLSLFPTLTRKDYYRSHAYEELCAKQLLEETLLEKKFRDSRGDLLDPAVLDQSLSEVRGRTARINHFLARCGFRRETESRAKIDVVAGLDPVYARWVRQLNERSVDAEYWDMVGRWRSSRLAIEEYKSVERGSKVHFSRDVRLPKAERQRRFADWRMEKEGARVNQKLILGHPRFVVVPPLLVPQEIKLELICTREQNLSYLDLASSQASWDEDRHVLCRPIWKPHGIYWTPEDFFSEEKEQARIRPLRADDIWGGSKGVTFLRGDDEQVTSVQSDWKATPEVESQRAARDGRLVVCGSSDGFPASGVIVALGK